MKTILKTVIIVCLLFSCKKEKPIQSTEKTITLKGKIVLNCSGTPMANRDVKVRLYLPDIKFEVLDVKTS
jgi:hypothetical protein